ncbi:MAG: decaprenyl-phosphate phosphoribosyltransferase [Ardenticatenia bacterium]|nr:decaprenyl-phosphate phosphoribosyltransferase [Ardenticatenia bacterium]
MAWPHTRAGNAVWSQLGALLETMRPKQWAKNLIIFVGLIFSDDRLLFHLPSLGRTTIAFFLFCLLSSSVYILNDLTDIEKDRKHPIKRHRPLPSGRLAPRVAQLALVAMLTIALTGSMLLGATFGIVALSYLLINIAYSFCLKNIVIVDVFTIAAGFVLRAVAGAVVIGVAISPWLYVVTILLALFLAIGKRRHELLLLEEGRGTHRRVLEEYTAPLLDDMLSVVMASTVIAYSLYTFTANNLPDNHAMMLTVPVALYGLFRYLYLIHRRNAGGAPEEVLFQDRPLLAAIVVWGIMVVSILYLLPAP